ncbi:uncharacterized protein [Venturia canescens]|uniref:uncharacterized protein n=1 Tax=Venturia canescens TaxID=32260 RepID=UPI001C9D627A|nr:uncharacterized protein LOC122407202 [Venturia canescens]
MQRFSRGWFVAWMFACITAYPTKPEKRGQTYGLNVDFGLSSENDYDFEDFPVEKYVDGRDKAGPETLEENGISGTSVKNAHVSLPLKLEPDAEMLPAHYRGVESPGVDHMEILSIDSSGMSTNSKTAVADGTKMVTGARVVSGDKTSEGFEKGLRIKAAKENRKGEYNEAAGKKKTHEEIDESFRGLKHETSGDKGVKSKVEAQRHKGHNAAGYRNVYHKDEYKKDADFYDNDHEGGRFRKHGRYDEKHVATESDFRNGGNRASEFLNAEAAKKGNSETRRASKKSKGHNANSGYDVFFDKFDEFAKQTSNGQSSGDNAKTAIKI